MNDMIKGKKILISMGGTYEPIDSVRGITNKSSGKMGLALAKEAYIRGADVTLVVANVSVHISYLFDVINVETSMEMNNTILSLVEDYDIFISTAAVSDFEFIDKFDKKLDSSSSLFLNLKPTTKIIRQIKRINPDIFLVGFKAEFNISRDDLICCAKKQINNAGTDLVVANDISQDSCHFGSDDNEVLIVSDDILEIPLSSKKNIAKGIFDVISQKID
ncbi:coenzyme A biosynthesis bifunctional protein CoaBC [Methanobrevibacter oralis]|uniref:Coenzyme A biosynthesis bifunctional protein CoaBC n=2 Tax=Methanobrevibacter oralis TaxID=66851 RepID=A0A165ZB22_METOA|nr:phosphopantothenoylcysteine decarboxylase [Methanobrevibacter oralis]KZX10484.1 coenzyme A biosynthesis bifunctional protein CoaBC [Methanobrevibacter oralis]